MYHDNLKSAGYLQQKKIGQLYLLQHYHKICPPIYWEWMEYVVQASSPVLNPAMSFMLKWLYSIFTIFINIRYYRGYLFYFSFTDIHIAKMI